MWYIQVHLYTVSQYRVGQQRGEVRERVAVEHDLRLLVGARHDVADRAQRRRLRLHLHTRTHTHIIHSILFKFNTNKHCYIVKYFFTKTKHYKIIVN